MDAPEKIVLPARDILPLVHEHQPVTGRERAPCRREHERHGIAVGGIYPLHAVLCLVLFYRFAVQPPRDVGGVPAFAEFLAVFREPYDGEELLEERVSPTHVRDEGADTLRLPSELLAAGDTVRIGIDLLRTLLYAVTAQIGDLPLDDGEKGTEILLRRGKDLFRICRNVVRAAVKLDELAEKVVGRALTLPQYEGEEVLHLHVCAHKRAEGLREIEPALLVLLHLAEHGATHPHGRVFDADVFLLQSGAAGKDLFGDLAAFLAREQTVDPDVHPAHLLFRIGAKTRRIDVPEVLLFLAVARQVRF